MRVVLCIVSLCEGGVMYCEFMHLVRSFTVGLVRCCLCSLSIPLLFTDLVFRLELCCYIGSPFMFTCV